MPQQFHFSQPNPHYTVIIYLIVMTYIAIITNLLLDCYDLPNLFSCQTISSIRAGSHFPVYACIPRAQHIKALNRHTLHVKSQSRSLGPLSESTGKSASLCSRLFFPFLLSDSWMELGVCREGLWTRPCISEKLAH